MALLHQSCLTSLPLLSRGKVRDIYAVGDDKLLIIATDRISAFDVVFDDPVPGKGQVLTAFTDFWLNRLASIVPNHSTNVQAVDVVAPSEVEQVVGRAVVVKRLKPILVEAVVRGYLIGSGWKDYRQTGAVCGIGLPEGLLQAARLPQPLFTPAAKADAGEHDVNVDFNYVVELIGPELAEKIRTISLQLYSEASAYAASRGIIIADTKFEFGLDAQGRLHLMDEVLTPDSSRFWPASAYAEGSSPPSFDKQYLRDWLEASGWNKKPPAPRLPAHVIDETAKKYHEALQCLTAP